MTSQQDEIDRIPKITCTQPSVFQNHVANGVLLVLGSNTTCSPSFYTHGSGNNSEVVSPAGAVQSRVGVVKPLAPGYAKNPWKLLFRAPKLSMVSPAGSSGQGQASYQRILAKTKTTPKVLGVVKPTHGGSLTSCTQQ
jgi:hypothetical protein